VQIDQILAKNETRKKATLIWYSEHIRKGAKVY